MRHQALAQAQDLNQIFNPPLNFPPKYPLKDMNLPANIGKPNTPVLHQLLRSTRLDHSCQLCACVLPPAELRQSELLVYYRRVAAHPLLLSLPHMLVVLGVETAQQLAAIKLALGVQSFVSALPTAATAANIANTATASACESAVPVELAANMTATSDDAGERPPLPRRSRQTVQVQADTAN